jgi:hypothetical protein
MDCPPWKWLVELLEYHHAIRARSVDDPAVEPDLPGRRLQKASGGAGTIA